jgi:SH3-like domain-containing protein
MKNWIFIFSLLLPFSAKSLCVVNDKVKLRAGPNDKSKVSWIVGQHMPLVEVEKKGAWYQVQDFEGEKHWVHARHVSGKGSCVVVKVKTANLRIGPGSNFAQTDLGSVRKYSTFRKIGRDEEWLKVQDIYGQVHWAHENTVWEPRNYTRVKF